ncbi:hypothetical protein PSA7680_00467 [Pseudoruegeria aquimaris]|uniref:Porin domain-containing protein n=1 Tax=Pseudoruegeria aquimaris TaxID=393663 RepID=A0A1Y5RGD5_9RHOB|nr:hypothetical protein [Pseudoruegeria aquimaris]SLN16591.1 hypothetical protein PSA7680_00467 [Pseudoruegeria aquimaris]
MALEFPKRLLCSTAAAALISPGIALADPTASINLSWVFGEGVAIGVKAFSNDESGEAAATIGLDYLFSAQQLRPNVGVAYIDDDFFIGADIGMLNTDWSSFNFGIGVGPVDSQNGAPSGPGGPGGSDPGEGSPGDATALR